MCSKWIKGILRDFNEFWLFLKINISQDKMLEYHINYLSVFCMYNFIQKLNGFSVLKIWIRNFHSFIYVFVFGFQLC